MFDKDMRGFKGSTVSISRFNRGEAEEIFGEVAKNGTMTVGENNEPICVLMDPKRYAALLEMLEDYQLFVEAEERMKSSKPSDFSSHEDVMKEFGIEQADLDVIDVEIE